MFYAAALRLDEDSRYASLEMRRAYTVVIERDEEGWFVASAPALGCAAQGRSRSVAVRRLREAIDSYIGVSRARGWAIPAETDNVIRSLKTAV